MPRVRVNNPSRDGLVEAGVKAADGVGASARDGAEAARQAAQAGARVASIAARSGQQTVQMLAQAVAEVEREETTRRAAESVAKLNQVQVELFNEQTRHNLQTLGALTRTVDWDRMFQIEGECMQANLDRMAELNSRYFEVSLVLMAAAMAGANDRARKAVGGARRCGGDPVCVTRDAAGLSGSAA